jgi:hypothetical protein
MHNSARLTVVIASMLAALSLPAMAQQNEPAPKRAPVQGQQAHPGQPQHGAPGPQFRAAPGQPGQVHGGPPGQVRGTAGEHAARAIGERGYSFRGDFRGRRDLATFNERERGIWYGGRWRHEVHGGRLGYWWEVNGVWYYYDRPLAGPPAFVSEVEMFDDDLDPGAPVVVGAPPVVYAPAPVYVPPPPPPVVCIGPLCVR